MEQPSVCGFITFTFILMYWLDKLNSQSEWSLSPKASTNWIHRTQFCSQKYFPWCTTLCWHWESAFLRFSTRDKLSLHAWPVSIMTLVLMWYSACRCCSVLVFAFWCSSWQSRCLNSWLVSILQVTPSYINNCTYEKSA